MHLVSAGAYGGQEVLEPLEMELEAVMSCHVVLEMEPRSSARAASVLNC